MLFLRAHYLNIFKRLTKQFQNLYFNKTHETNRVQDKELQKRGGE